MGIDVVATWQEQQEERIAEIRCKAMKAYLSRNGLRPHEIMVLYYARSFKTDQTEFQSFWRYEYGIENPRSILDILLNKGFIGTASASDSLTKCTIAELKGYLKEVGLSTTGRKAELITRLIQSTTEEYLEYKISSRSYCLTELGVNELQENEYVSYFHKKHRIWPCIDVWWMNKQLHDYPNSSYKDLIWAELNRESQLAVAEMLEGRYRRYIWNRISMHGFLVEEGKNHDALRLLVEAAYYAANYDAPDSYWHALQNRDIIGGEILTHISNILQNLYRKEFKEIREKISGDDTAFFHELLSIINCFQKTNDILLNNELAQLIISQIDDNQERIIAISQKMEKLIEQRYKHQGKTARSGILPTVTIEKQAPPPADSLKQKILGFFSKK